jgi:GNAT superfamily N-acetyltransferase
LTLVDVGPDDPRLAAFHRGIYLAAFADKQEPLAAWQAALRGEAPYTMTVRLAIASPGSAGARSTPEGSAESIDGDVIAGGICAERYPASGVGLLTYMVVAPAYRARGLGRQLLDDAIAGLGATIVLGEVVDPERAPSAEASERLARFLRWGARILDCRYIQPALGPGLVRDRSLLLVAFPPLPDVLDGAVVQRFIEELYAITEGGDPDRECAICARLLAYGPVP